jgi:hypothetical protein
VVDIMANAAFYYGLLRMLTQEDRPLWSQMSFSAAEENFHAGAREGIDARLYWPGLGEVPAAELVVRRLLPLAREGLERLGVDSADADRLLGIIERRCVTLRNGAAWQSQVFHRLYNDKGMDRGDALREMTRRYREHMHSNEPVHTWPTEPTRRHAFASEISSGGNAVGIEGGTIRDPADNPAALLGPGRAD